MRATVRAVVFMTTRAHMPDIPLPEGMDLLCYEDLIDGGDEPKKRGRPLKAPDE